MTPTGAIQCAKTSKFFGHVTAIGSGELGTSLHLLSSQTAFIIFTLSRLDTCHFSACPRNLQIWSTPLTNMMAPVGRFLSIFGNKRGCFFCKKSVCAQLLVGALQVQTCRKARHRYSTSQEFQTSKKSPTKQTSNNSSMIQEPPSRSIKLEDLPIPRCMA